MYRYNLLGSIIKYTMCSCYSTLDMVRGVRWLVIYYDWRSYFRLMKYSMTITTMVMVYLTIATVSISFLNLLNQCFALLYHCFSTIKSFFMISLPIRLSINYQVKQINYEVGKKHHRESTYNNPNIQIKIIIPSIYLVNHLFIRRLKEKPNYLTPYKECCIYYEH